MVQFNGQELATGAADPATAFMIFAGIMGVAVVIFIGWSIYHAIS